MCEFNYLKKTTNVLSNSEYYLLQKIKIRKILKIGCFQKIPTLTKFQFLLIGMLYIEKL